VDRRVITLCAAALALGCARPAAAPAPPPANAGEVRGESAVTVADLRRDLYIFADDSFRGRDAATGDAARAARFLAAQAAAIGLEPAGDSGTFLQRVPIVREYLGAASRVTVTMPNGTSQILAIGPQLLPAIALGEDVPLPKLDAEGDLVFGGYGAAVPGAPDELADQSIAGKAVVFVMETPPGIPADARAAFEREHPVAERIARLAERGPSAIIVLMSGRAAQMMPAIAAEIRDSAPRLGEFTPAVPRTMPMVLYADPKGASPFLPAGWPAPGKPRTLTGRRLSAHIDYHYTMVPAFNVVGIRRGADPALRGGFVAFGAHLDHIGIQRPERGDSIANGADDDGSGSVALLAIARAAVAQRPPPRRSMLFVWHTGEELGLYGSEWFTAHPAVPLDSIVAQLNADMIGRNAPDSLYLVGPHAAPNHQSLVLGQIVDSVNKSLARPFIINREWDSPSHPEQIYYRSDHYNYARNGIPVVFFTSGLHADYHQVSDEPAKIDFTKLSRVAAFIFDVGLAVADRDARPFPVTHITGH
jgi:hypothetical protein